MSEYVVVVPCLLPYMYLLVTTCGQRALLYDPKGEAEHPDLAPEDVVRSIYLAV